MTKKEAKEFLIYFEERVSESHFVAHFKSSRPLAVVSPELYDKKREAEIVLGIFQWQRPYEQIKKVFPSISLEKYNQYREKYKL